MYLTLMNAQTSWLGHRAMRVTPTVGARVATLKTEAFRAHGASSCLAAASALPFLGRVAEKVIAVTGRSRTATGAPSEADRAVAGSEPSGR